ncbi:sulfotransferase family protein [Nocardioides sp. BGMRC 2183]|nr:sulfotransferase family protein [Nocardioides sp. BGMRC 2183]
MPDPKGPARRELTPYFPGKPSLNYHLFPLPSHLLFYVKNPKAGCSTVLVWLDRLHSGEHDFAPANVHTEHRLPRPRDLGWPVVSEMLGGAAYRFSFVRDPLRRFESAYRDKVVRQPKRRVEIQRTLGLTEDVESEVSFEQFVTAVEQQDPVTEMNPHWRPQHVNLMHPVLHYDRIGRLESFDTDLALIREEAGLPDVPYQVRNISSRAGEASAYDGRPDLVRRVQTVYAKDFELYGY